MEAKINTDMSIENFEVLNLFPNKVGVFNVSEDLSNLEKVKDFRFESINRRAGNHNLYRTLTLDLLKQFPREEQILIDYFNKFKNEALGYQDIDFYIHRSWATRAEENGCSHSHAHNNTYYTGVLYFDDIVDSSGIEFTSEGLRPFIFQDSPPITNNVVFEIEKFVFKVRKNVLLFFPAYLKHAIMPNLGKNPRYSIAFDFLPR